MTVKQHGAFVVTEGLNEQDEADLTDRLTSFNLAQASAAWSSPETMRSVTIGVRNGAGSLVGGLIGRTHAIPFWLDISVLWVDQAARGRGLGAALVRRAEAIALERHCRHARLASSQYQAPTFYLKLGYVEYGRLDDCPPGETVYYLRKDLDIST